MRSTFDPYDADEGYYQVPPPQYDSRPSTFQYGQSLSNYGAPLPEPSNRFSGRGYGHSTPEPDPYGMSQAHSAYSEAASPIPPARTPSEGHAEENAPSLVGAFTTLIKRITPEDQPHEKQEHPVGRLGQDFGRDRQTFEESPPAATWTSPWQSPRQTPMDNEKFAATGSPPPASDTSQGWSYGGWGWNSLFGASEENKPIADEGYQLNPYGNETNESARLSYHADTFAVDRYPLENSMTRSPYDDYDKYDWPARNPDYDDGYGAKVNTPNKYQEWMASAKAALPKFPTDWRDIDVREGFAYCTHLVLNCTSSYTEAGPARCPCICASIYFFFFLLFMIIGIAVGPMEIETDFDAFMKTDVNSSVQRDTFKEAIRSRTIGRRLQAPLFLQNDIFIAYELTDRRPGSIFQQSVMGSIAAFERDLTSLSGWGSYCNKGAVGVAGVDSSDFPLLCNPGISLVQYALPSMTINISDSIIPQTMTFDGRGGALVPIDTTLRLTEQLKVAPIVFPIGFQRSDAGSTRRFRSVFRFKEYCCTSQESQGETRPKVDKIKEDWEEFVKETVLPFLQEKADELKDSEDSDYLIFFGGTGFGDIEVRQTLMNDTWLAAGGLTFVLFYLLFHTQSPFLSFVGLVIVFLAVPFSYVIFAILASTRTMNIASFLSLFLVVGLGSDVVFVYTDFWREAIRVKGSLAEQLTYTLQRGGKASLATTVTTALSFFANLASVLRPLREFGFFMGLCVTFVWVLITLIYVPLCAVDSTYFQVCTLFRRNGRRPKETSWQRNFGRVATCVHTWRRVLLVFAALQLIAFIICVAVLAETDSGMPNIFPKEHNQNRGKETLERFSPIDEVMDIMFAPPKRSEEVCHEYEFNDDDQTACSLFWCEVDATPKSNADDCKCFKKDRVCGGGTRSVDLRAVGTDSLSSSVIEAHIKQGLGSVSVSSTTGESLAPINLEDWETGINVLMPMQHANAVLQSQIASCWDELCFCNTEICKLPSGWNLLPYALPNSEGSSSSLRLLQGVSTTPPPTWRIAPPQRAIVNVVFGIDVKLESPLLGELEPSEMWSFLSNFDMSQPWSQRNIYEMCSNAPANLRIASMNCWIADFRQYLVSRNKRFPVQKNNFESYVSDFLVNGLTNLRSSSDFLWMRDGTIIKACFVDFFVDVDRHEQYEPAIDYMKKWTTFMDTWNDDAARSTRGAWHTSELWVRAEAQEELVASTITTLVIVICLAFVGMLVFTFDLLLSLYVVLATLFVLIGLAFFIVVVMSWEIGPIEVIALIVFIGYAVTYSLHIAHKYGSSDALELTPPPQGDWEERARIRFQRTQFALKSIGSAALGSAATTIGCSIFLLFCTLTVFKKLGGVVLVVTLLSIITAFFNLPAVLLMIGPTRPGQYWWVWLWCRNWRSHIDRLRGRKPAPQYPPRLALESFPSQQMIPEEESRAPPASMQLPAKQMHVRILHTAQVPKPRGMRPSVEALPPLALESNGNVKVVGVGNRVDGEMVHKGKVIGINGNASQPVMPTGAVMPPAEMADVQLRGFDQAVAVNQNPNPNMLRGNQQPLQNQQASNPNAQRFGAANNARALSPDPQTPAPKKATYSMPRRDRFANNSNRGNNVQGNGLGPSNNAPGQRR